MKSLRLSSNTRPITSFSNVVQSISIAQSSTKERRLLHQNTSSRPCLANTCSDRKNLPTAPIRRTISVVAAPTEQFPPFLQSKQQAARNMAISTAPEPMVHSMFEKKTGTWQYVVADPATKKAAIIDAVLDFDPNTRTISTATADHLLETIINYGYHVERILETHAHADHLTAASYLQYKLLQLQGGRPPICIGKRIEQVQRRFAAKYNIPAEEYEGVFDRLLEDDESFALGNLTVNVMHLPGHTPDHIGYQIAKNVFCGDSIFHADIGTARCDFPGGSARDLYTSAQKLLSLPEDVKVWTGHDYPSCPERCDPVPWMTVGDHRERNKHVSKDVAERDFLILRQERDAGLAAPKLLDPSLQINIRAGRLPRLTPSGERLLSFPIQLQCEAW